MTNTVLAGRAATVGAAALTAGVGWAAASAAADLQVPSGSGWTTVGLSQALFAGLVAGALGMVVATVLQRVVRRPRTLWTAIASAGLLVSLLGPLGARTPEAVVALVLLHLAVGAVVIAGGRWTLPAGAPAPTLVAQEVP